MLVPSFLAAGGGYKGEVDEATRHNAMMIAWQVGMATMFFIGLVKLIAEEEDKIALLDYGRSGYESQLTVAEPMVIDANALMMMFMGPMMMEGMGGMPEGMEGMYDMDPEMLEALEALESMGG